MFQPTRSHNSGHFWPCLILLLVWLGNTAHALDSDRFQPIDVAADSAILDDKAGKAIYRGNVVLTQGSLKIIANKLTIEAGTEGKVEKVIATGNLARFEQIPNPNEKPIEAEAETVEYYVANEKIVLTENARVVQNDNLFEGNIIEYDIKEQKLQAHGRTLTTDSGEKESGRVKMVLQPQTETTPETAPQTAPESTEATSESADATPKPQEPAPESPASGSQQDNNTEDSPQTNE